MVIDWYCEACGRRGGILVDETIDVDHDARPRELVTAAHNRRVAVEIDLEIGPTCDAPSITYDVLR